MDAGENFAADGNLLDDGPATSIAGTLLISPDENKIGGLSRDQSAGNLEAVIGKEGGAHSSPGPSGVSFQVVNYRLIKEAHARKYVMYSLVILRSGSGLDEAPTVIDRRYSDFERLNSALHKKAPGLMRDIAFPRKKITGNFKPETIAERSRAFEQFLSHVFSMDSLRVTTDFTDFFFGADLQKAYHKLRNGSYEEAIEFFKESLGIQRKLLGDSDRKVLATLCGLAAASNQLEKYDHAHLYCETALKCTETGPSAGGKYLVPLLELSIRLCWQLGKDKADLEHRLREVKKTSCCLDGAQSLLEVVVSDTSVLNENAN